MKGGRKMDQEKSGVFLKNFEKKKD